MILRRITENIKSQNWFVVGIELVILVLGVFIGIQVSNWNEERKERQIAAGYLDRLENDLREEIDNYHRYIDYYELVYKHTNDALEAFSKPVETLDSEFLVDLYQASQRWNIGIRRGTYDELLASGRIGLIADQNTRAMLSNHYEASFGRMMTLERSTNPTYRAVLRMKMDERVQYLVRENCGDTYTVTDTNNFYLTLPSECEINIPDDISNRAIQSLHADEKVRSELRFHVSEIGGLLGSIRNGIEMNQAVLSELAGDSQ